MGQETKMVKNSQLRTKNSKNYRIFQLQRQEKGVQGGGLVMGVLPDLQPVLLRQGDDDTEIISVLITVDKMSIRLVTAYGRQEVDRDQDGHKDNQIKDKFWAFLDREIKEAEEKEQGVILGFDSNCHPGPSVVKNDPMPGPNKNGQRFLASFLTSRRLSSSNFEISELSFFLLLVTRIFLKHFEKIFSRLFRHILAWSSNGRLF